MRFELVLGITCVLIGNSHTLAGSSLAEVSQIISIISFSRQRIGRAPGTKWRYADAGFNLLGRVVEIVTGKPFSEALRVRLVKPIGMENSGFDISCRPVDARVAAFDKQGR